MLIDSEINNTVDSNSTEDETSSVNDTKEDNITDDSTSNSTLDDNTTLEPEEIDILDDVNFKGDLIIETNTILNIQNCGAFCID